MSIVASTISIVNSTQLGGQQTAVQTVALADGGYVTAWTTDQGTQKDVVFQRYDADGNKVGGPVTANATLNGNQVLTDIVATGDGSFTLAWTNGTKVTTRSFDETTGVAVSAEVDLTVAGSSATGAQIIETATGQYKVITTSVSAGSTVIEQATFTTAGVAVTAKSTISSSAPADGAVVEVVDGNVDGSQLILLSGGRVVSSANGSIRNLGDAADILQMQNGFHVLADRHALGAMLVGLFGTSGNMNSYTTSDGQVVDNPESDAPVSPAVYDRALVNLGNGRLMVIWVADTGVDPVEGIESDGIYAAVYDTNAGEFVDGGAFLIKDFGADTVLDLSSITLEADLLADGRVGLSWSSDNGLTGLDISTTILDPRYGKDGSLNQAGSGGDDLMGGTAANDVLSGGLGNDAIAGMKGDDTLSGGDGDDIIHGNTGNDLIFGGAGNDVLVGGDDVNVLHGGDGDDKIVSGAGDDTITGGAGNDRIGGGEGFNIIDGGEGIDTLFLTNSGSTYVDLDDLNSPVGDMTDFLANDDLIVGIENLSGSDAGEYLAGNSGVNVLLGGGGNDILFGRDGADRLNGGEGADQFIYESASDGGDRIRQFTVGSDKIVIVSENFAGIDADNIFAALNVNGSGNAASAGPKFTFDNSGVGAGILSYDADGSGAGAKVTLATIRFDSEFGLSLFSAADFMFI